MENFTKVVNNGKLIKVSADVFNIAKSLDSIVNSNSIFIFNKYKHPVNRIVLILTKKLGSKVFIGHPAVEEFVEDPPPNQINKDN